MADPILPTACDFHGKCRDLLHAANLRHGTEGFTSPPKEGMLTVEAYVSPSMHRGRQKFLGLQFLNSASKIIIH